MVEIVEKLAAYYRGCFWRDALRVAAMPGGEAVHPCHPSRARRPYVRERRPPGRHGEQLYTYFYFPLASRPGGEPALPEGRVERWGLRGEVSCAHLRADLEVGAPVTP